MMNKQYLNILLILISLYLYYVVFIYNKNNDDDLNEYSLKTFDGTKSGIKMKIKLHFVLFCFFIFVLFVCLLINS